MTADYGAVEVVDVVGRHEIENLPGSPQLSQFRQHTCGKESAKSIFLHVALTYKLINFIEKDDSVIQLRELVEDRVRRLLDLGQTLRHKMAWMYLNIIPADDIR